MNWRRRTTLDPDDVDVSATAAQIVVLLEQVEELLASIRTEAARLMKEEHTRDRPAPSGADPTSA